MRNKKIEEKKQEEKTPSLEEFLEAFKKENPNCTEEELAMARSFFESALKASNNNKTFRPVLRFFVRGYWHFLLIFIVMAGLFNSLIVLDPYWLVFPFVMIMAALMVLGKFFLSFLVPVVKNMLVINIIGIAINTFILGIVSTYFYPIFTGVGGAFIFAFVGEAAFQMIEIMIARWKIRKWSNGKIS